MNARKVHLGDSVSAELSEGSSGAAVKELQAKLNALGVAQLNVDGKFGSDTTNAVQTFQQAEQLNVTGTLTPETEGRLNQRILAAQATLQAPDTGVIAQAKSFLDPSKRPLWQTGLMVLGGIAIVGGVVYLISGADAPDGYKKALSSRTVEHDEHAPTKYKRTVRAHGASLRGTSEKCPRSPEEEKFDEGEGVSVS